MATLTITGVPGPIADAITARLDPPPLDTVVAGVDGLPTGAFLDIEPVSYTHLTLPTN